MDEQRRDVLPKGQRLRNVTAETTNAFLVYQKEYLLLPVSPAGVVNLSPPAGLRLWPCCIILKNDTEKHISKYEHWVLTRGCLKSD